MCISKQFDGLQDLVTKQSSLEFMLSHSEKFDEHHLKLARNTICGLPERAGLDGTSAAKVLARHRVIGIGWKRMPVFLGERNSLPGCCIECKRT